MSEQLQSYKDQNKSRTQDKLCQEWWRQDRLDAIGWAAIFIWGGLIMLAETTNFAKGLTWWNGWGLFFTGAGIVVLLGTLIRQFVPGYHRSLAGGLIFGLILLGIGLGGWEWIWPLVLVAIGITIFISALRRRP